MRVKKQIEMLEKKHSALIDLLNIYHSPYKIGERIYLKEGKGNQYVITDCKIQKMNYNGRSYYKGEDDSKFYDYGWVIEATDPETGETIFAHIDNIERIK